MRQMRIKWARHVQGMQDLRIIYINAIFKGEYLSAALGTYGKTISVEI